MKKKQSKPRKRVVKRSKPSHKKESSHALPPPLLKIKVGHLKHLSQVHTKEELLFILNELDEIKRSIFIKECEKQKNLPQDVEEIIQKGKEPEQIKELLKKSIITDAVQELNSLNDRIATARKKGIDMYFEELQSLRIPFKIRMFEATAKKNDFYVVKKGLSALAQEVVKKEKETPHLP